MTLVNRSVVEGTSQPVMYIGHKRYRGADGSTKRTKSYYAEWCINNRQQRKSLQATNKVAAFKAAYELHRKICTGERLEQLPKISIDDLAAMYLADCEARDLAPRTIGKYQLTIGNFQNYCREHSIAHAERIGEPEFWKFVETMRRLSKKTRYDRIVIVQQMFKWAYERAEVVPRNPLRKLKLRKPEPNRQPCFTPEQIRRLIETAGFGLKPKVVFLSYTGVRFGELRDLRWEDVDLGIGTHGVLHICRGGSGGQTKNRKPRRIPIHPELAPVIAGLPRTGDRVFPAAPSTKHPDGDGPLSERRFLRSIKRLCRRCEFRNPDQYTIHTFRHAFASLLARENVSYRYALSLMGHGSSKILELYYTMFDADAERAIAAIRLPRLPPDAA